MQPPKTEREVYLGTIYGKEIYTRCDSDAVVKGIGEYLESARRALLDSWAEQPPKTDWVVVAVTVGAVLFGMGLVLQIV